MADKKIIAVVGATGAQGGGLVRAILNDPDGGFAARAMTRNAGSDKAKALAAAGAEVVEGSELFPKGTQTVPDLLRRFTQEDMLGMGVRRAPQHGRAVGTRQVGVAPPRPHQRNRSLR